MKKMKLKDVRKALEALPQEYDEYPVVVPDNEAGCFNVTDVWIGILEEGDRFAKELNENCICIGY